MCPRTGFHNTIHLPTTLDAARALPAAIWQIFWADLVNTELHALLTQKQRNLLRDLIRIFQYYNIPMPHVAGSWGSFLHLLYLAAETGANFGTPGEEILEDLSMWAHMHIPDAFAATAPLLGGVVDLQGSHEAAEDDDTSGDADDEGDARNSDSEAN
ncbi:hypothetical protein C8T65DRAFT_747540 [Cerioporus squamosus]|nr:hypothetical protein C8T65DRAFT_747540 [Cerioporus squamosus]